MCFSKDKEYYKALGMDDKTAEEFVKMDKTLSLMEDLRNNLIIVKEECKKINKKLDDC